MQPPSLEQFVADFLAGKIFVSAQVSRHEDLALVFLPLALGGIQFNTPEDKQKQRILVENCLPAMKDPNDAKERSDRDTLIDRALEHFFPDVGVLYEYLSESIPGRGINGYPIFTSCHVLCPKDWKRARAAIEREQKRTIEV